MLVVLLTTYRHTYKYTRTRTEEHLRPQRRSDERAEPSDSSATTAALFFPSSLFYFDKWTVLGPVLCSLAVACFAAAVTTASSSSGISFTVIDRRRRR